MSTPTPINCGERPECDVSRRWRDLPGEWLSSAAVQGLDDHAMTIIPREAAAVWRPEQTKSYDAEPVLAYTV